MAGLQTEHKHWHDTQSGALPINHHNQRFSIRNSLFLQLQFEVFYTDYALYESLYESQNTSMTKQALL